MSKIGYRVFKNEFGWTAIVEKSETVLGCVYHTTIDFNDQTMPNTAVYQHGEISPEDFHSICRMSGLPESAFVEVPFSSIPKFQQERLKAELEYHSM